MDPRIVFFQKLISDKTKRILELGPLNRPIADKSDYPNTFYCDIRSTEEVRKLYSGNDYLAATGISVDSETILPIDYIVHGSYAESLSDVEQFDYVIASHVLEHINDLIFTLQDISKIIKPGGIFCIVYPDKRYCFDHFRVSASFRDAYNVFRQGVKENAAMVFDFYYSVIPENNPVVFWEEEDVLNNLPRADYENAVAHYEQALNGVRMDDVHYWPFTDMDFLKFLYDCTRAKLLPFRCVAFQPCAVNDQQFMLALQLDNSVLDNPESALSNLRRYMRQTLPCFYSNKSINLQKNNEALRLSLQEQTNQINELRSTMAVLQDERNKLYEDCNNLQKNIIAKDKVLEDHLRTVGDLKLMIADLQQHNQLQKDEIQAQLQVIENCKFKNNELNKNLCLQNEIMNTQRVSIDGLVENLREQRLMFETINCKINENDNLRKENLQQLQVMQQRILQLETIENSTIWRMTKPLRKVLDCIKNIGKGSR